MTAEHIEVPHLDDAALCWCQAPAGDRATLALADRVIELEVLLRRFERLAPLAPCVHGTLRLPNLEPVCLTHDSRLPCAVAEARRLLGLEPTIEPTKGATP